MSIVRLKKIFILLFFSLSCYSKINLCDDFDFQSHQCINHPMNLELELKKHQTFKELSNQLYFQQKWTMGILVQSMLLHVSNFDSLKCFYSVNSDDQTLKSVFLELEGYRWMNQYFWCFDYLGSMLSNFYNLNQLEQKSPLELNYDTQILKIELSLFKNDSLQKKFSRLIIIKNLY